MLYQASKYVVSNAEETTRTLGTWHPQPSLDIASPHQNHIKRNRATHSTSKYSFVLTRHQHVLTGASFPLVCKAEDGRDELIRPPCSNESCHKYEARFERGRL